MLKKKSLRPKNKKYYFHIVCQSVMVSFGSFLFLFKLSIIASFTLSLLHWPTVLTFLFLLKIISRDRFLCRFHFGFFFASFDGKHIQRHVSKCNQMNWTKLNSFQCDTLHIWRHLFSLESIKLIRRKFFFLLGWLGWKW